MISEVQVDDERVARELLKVLASSSLCLHRSHQKEENHENSCSRVGVTSLSLAVDQTLLRIDLYVLSYDATADLFLCRVAYCTVFAVLSYFRYFLERIQPLQLSTQVWKASEN
jgi:Na+/glutamate symporter